jgi:hypothetical protein
MDDHHLSKITKIEEKNIGSNQIIRLITAFFNYKKLTFFSKLRKRN